MSFSLEKKEKKPSLERTKKGKKLL